MIGRDVELTATSEPRAAPPQGDILALGYGEHLMVWSLRRLARQGYPCPLVEREFLDACGADGVETLATFRAFLGLLAYGGRRRLCVGHPGCLRLTGDERRLLALLAVAQTEDAAWLDAHLCWLVRVELRPRLAAAARALGAALAAHDLRLPLPRLGGVR